MNSIRSMIGSGLLVAGLLTSPWSALATGSDDGFAAFWTQFIAAVGKGDQRAVSQMVRYPIYYNGLRQESYFPAIWKNNFKSSHRTCLARGKPVKDTPSKGDPYYVAFCSPLMYIFEKNGAGWKLADFGVDD